MVDTAGTEGRDPVKDYTTINAELLSYDRRLAELPQVVAANKMDLPDADTNLPGLAKVAAGHGRRLFPISAVTRHGLKDVYKRQAKNWSSLPSVRAVCL